MRVADNVSASTITSNLQRTFARIHRFQTELSTGTTIQNASDDPNGAQRSLLLRSDIRRNEQYQRNIEDGLGQINHVDSVLNDLVSAMTEVRGIAIQGASDTVNAEDRDILAKEVNEVLEFALALSHSKFRGDFLFSGTETHEVPYEATRDSSGKVTSIDRSLRHSIGVSDRTTAVGTLLGQSTSAAGTVTIGDQTVAIDLNTDSLDTIKANIEAAAPTGVSVVIDEAVSNGVPVFRLKINGTSTVVDSNNVLGTLGIGNIDTTNGVFRAVDDGVKVQMNVPGRDIFEGAQNPFTSLLNLRNALEADDREGIYQSITDLEASRTRISDARGVMGARTSRVELSRGLLERFEVTLTQALSNTEDVDFAQTVTNLQREQSVFQSAVITGQTINQPTLLEFLG